ncbi:olfactory receptor 51G2-like [Lissotriton helveticus]
MSTMNSSSSSAPFFILMGFPGAEAEKIWLTLPLSFLYLQSILGNGLILFTIKTDSQLREPMHLLLCMLSATDLGLALSTLPTVLGVYWFDYRIINLDACLVQLFCMHSLCSVESAILVAMAYDRFIAICNPLRYASLMHPIIGKVGLVAVLRGAGIHVPIPVLLSRLPFCDNKALSHAFCYQSDVMKLACADTTINSMYGLVLVLTTYILDSSFIAFSYVMILKSVLSASRQAERTKALNTCVSHLCVVFLFYVPLYGVTLAHRYGRSSSPLLIILMGLFFLALPPALNPIVYSIKNKQIRDAIGKKVWVKKTMAKEFKGHHNTGQQNQAVTH